MAKSLMTIEGARRVVEGLPVDLALLAGLRETARRVTTHHSTRIEGNRLTLAEVDAVLVGQRFPGRERDEAEVRNYYRAIEAVETLAADDRPLREADIRRMHALAFAGRRTPTPYRDGQNMIREGGTGRLVYLPPEATDVPMLMRALVAWVKREVDSAALPVPVIAGLAHYQFATIHPYYDGNGRTARLLTTLLLHRGGYGLKGIYSLEEHYSRNLPAYYRALTVGDSHNYYEGRARADVTGFLAYFLAGMAEAFTGVQAVAAEAAVRGAADQQPSLEGLGARERQVLALLKKQGTATAAEIASHLGLSPRTVPLWCRRWVREGLLDVHDPSRKNRSYRCGARFVGW